MVPESSSAGALCAGAPEPPVELSIVAPVYDEAGNVEGLVAEIEAALAPLGREFEMLLVDDGSTDGTRGVLRRLRERHPRLRIVLLRRNFGQTAALQAGLDRARGEVVVTIDGDGENDPADVPKLLARLEQGDVDMVCGWRVERWRGAVLSRRLPSAVANRIISRATGLALHDYGCTLRAFRRWVADELELYGEMHRFVPAIARDLGARILELPVAYRPRRYGASKYGLSRSVRVILDLLTVKFLSSFKTRPIQVFGLWGLGAVGVGALWTLWLVFERQVYDVPLGNRPQLMLAVLLLFTGMQFVTLGLLGEMLARTYHESQKKPIYVVEEELGG